MAVIPYMHMTGAPLLVRVCLVHLIQRFFWGGGGGGGGVKGACGPLADVPSNLCRRHFLTFLGKRGQVHCLCIPFSLARQKKSIRALYTSLWHPTG